MNDKKPQKKKSVREKRAFRFLCVILAFIVVFISAVCVLLNKRNSEIKAKLKAANTSAAETNSVLSGETSTDTPTTTDKTTTTATETTKPATAESTTKQAAAGTLANPAIVTISKTSWYLTLVNSKYRIPSSYTPQLVTVCGGSERLDKRVATHYEEMYNAAKSDGVTLTPCSGYRSYDLQDSLYDRKISYFENQGYSHDNAAVEAAKIVMPPGSSEHNLGLAMDIVCVEDWFEDTDEYAWLTEHAADYGFILRYPKDTSVTNVIYEPWHWRYVGVEDAKKIKASGQVLEQYLGVE